MVVNNVSQSGRYYQSANADAQSIKEDFLIRLHEFELIMNDIRSNPMKGSVQHYLLLGRRGSGKSTLLRRIQVEIMEDELLSQKFVAVNLAEEQANIYRLFDLINEILDELEEKNIVVNRPPEVDDCNLYTRNLVGALHEAITMSGKKVILLLDNIDRIFENILEDQGLLREMLLNYDDVKIIGGSTRMTEHFWKYEAPFYQFFRQIVLGKLSSEEIKTLLLHWSNKPGYEELRNFVAQRPGQLETVRLLTDGLPRTLQFFVNIIVNKEQETGYEYLRQIMDVMTPQYQERLNSLPPAQRKIVLQMAFLWEAAGTKDIATACKMNNNTVSAQMKQLTDKGIVEKIETGNKNHLYRLEERFFNLWLIFTQGSPKEKRKAKYLTVFMEHFYDESGLQLLISNHLKSLQENKLSTDKAAILTKALAQSRFVNSGMRDALLDYTLKLPDMAEELKMQLPQKISNISDEVLKLANKSEYAKAIKLAKSIEQEDGVREYLLGNIHLFKGDHDLAEKYLSSSAEKEFSAAYYFLGALKNKIGEKKEAEKYYKKAIEFGYPEVIIDLADLYAEQNKFKLAEKYYLKAIEAGHNEAIIELADIYADQNKFVLAEKYYLKAIDLGEKDALFNLAMIYAEKKRYEEAESLFITAINQGEEDANLPLAFLYYLQGINKEKAAELIANSKDTSYSEEAFIVVCIWIGDISKAIEQLNQLITDENYDYLGFVFENLLYHFQVNLVNEIFNNAENGMRLQEKFLPLYFAVNLIVDIEKNLSLRIPPEIQETVTKIIKRVKEKQEFYYGK